VLGPVILLVPATASLPLVVALLTVSYFMAYLWLVMSNILITDLFRNKGVGVAAGLVNAFGTVGAAVFTSYIGVTLDTLGYGPVFLALACLHPLAAVVLQLAYGRALLQRPGAVL
jgi:ACS family hexuronate transporter-like MFS transporter